MPEEYASLELLEDITAVNGALANQIVIYRPTCKAMCDIIDAVSSGGTGTQVQRFVKNCVRAKNGGTELLDFNATDLNAADGGELTGILNAMFAEAAEVELSPDNGDGIFAPLVYTLKYPIKLTAQPDAEKLTQISFVARRIRDISEFLDARNEADQFRAFMRGFGTPMGIKVPILSDTLIDSLDFVDYLVIRGPLIMGKFTAGRGRWKKASSHSH